MFTHLNGPPGSQMCVQWRGVLNGSINTMNFALITWPGARGAHFW